MRTLNEMLEEINSTIGGSMTYPKTKFWNEAFLQTKGEQTFPLVNNGNQQGYKISLNDKYALQCYHRVIDSETETDPNRGYGSKPYRIRVYTMRMVWLGNLKKLPAKTYETTDDIKSGVYSWIPVILSGKETIRTTNENVNKIDVLSEEFEGVNADHLSLDVIAFYIEYEIRQRIIC